MLEARVIVKRVFLGRIGLMRLYVPFPLLYLHHLSIHPHDTQLTQTHKVINWFLHTSNSLNQKYNRTLPSLAFFHIPVSEMLDYQEDNDPLSKSSGINDERVNQQGYGGGFDFDDQDAKFMRALADTEGLIATFSGHDHGNDW